MGIEVNRRAARVGPDDTLGSSPGRCGQLSPPTYAVLVRLRSELEHEEIVRVMKERAPEFRALDGLEQKYYLHHPETGEYGGFYVWSSFDDVAAYRESELAATIAEAYAGVGAPQVDVFEIVMPLRD